jgi:ABC-type multidrug transport system fused ATPase/permease subunit
MDYYSNSRQAAAHRGTTGRAWRLYALFVFVSLTAFPFLFSLFGYSPLQAFLALALVNICIFPTANYYANGKRGLPALAILCWSFAIQFGLPFFTREPVFELANKNFAYLDDEVVTYALVFCILGSCFFQMGFYLVQKSRLKKALPIVKLHLDEKKSIVFCLVVGLLLPFVFSAQWLIPSEYILQLSAIINLLNNQSLVVIGILGWMVYTKRPPRWLIVALYALVVVSVVRGFSSTMLEQAVAPIVVFSIIKWSYTGRLPVFVLGVVLFLALFLSPVKTDFRKQLRYDTPAEQGAVSNAQLWFEQAANYWADALSGNRSLEESTSALTSRTDFLHQFAHIYSLTPSSIDYQYGGTYTFFIYTLIPRVIWPEKPLSGTANDYYAITYGVATEESIKTSTFGVSLIGESYINFGVYGVIIVMMIQGALIALLQHVFGSQESGPGGQAVFLAFFVFFLNGIGSSAEILFGGILQNLLAGCVLLLWVRGKSPRLPSPKLPATRAPEMTVQRNQRMTTRYTSAEN